MARLIDDLLDVSRINRGMIDLKLEDASLDALVAKALEATQGLIEAGGHRVSVRVDEGIAVQVDGARTQVIGNLLANAAKYTLRGGSIEIEFYSEPELARLLDRLRGPERARAF